MSSINTDKICSLSLPEKMTLGLFAWILLLNVLGMIIVASTMFIASLTIFMSVILGLLNVLFLVQSYREPSLSFHILATSVDLSLIVIWIIVSASGSMDYPVAGIIFHVLAIIPTVGVLMFLIYCKYNEWPGKKDTKLNENARFYCPWEKTMIPLATSCLAVLFCLICQIVVVATSSVVKTDPFYNTSISSYLDETYGASVPLFLMVIIFIGATSYFRHPIFYDSQIAWENILALATNALALLGLFGLIIFSNGHSNKSPNSNLQTHLAFTNMCFICFSLYELFHTLGFSMNVLNGNVKPSIAAILILGSEIVCNVCTFAFYAAWQASNMEQNVFEWISVMFIWFYFITIGLLCHFILPAHEKDIGADNKV